MRYYDTYDAMYSSSEDTIVGIFMVYLIVLLVVGIFGIVSYILKGIGMYTIAKRQGRDNAWIAFVPFARTYLHGELGGSIRLKNRSIQSPGIWLLALPFVYGAVFIVFYLIICIIGVGAAVRFSDYYGYGPSIGAGTIMGLVVSFVVLVAVSVLYQGAYKVLGILVNHQIFEKFTSKNMSIAHAVLCAFIPLYEAICLFVMRNKPYNPGMEPEIRNPYYPYGQVPPAGQYYDSRMTPPPQGPEYSWRPVEEPVQSTMRPSEPQQPVNTEQPISAEQPVNTEQTVSTEQPMSTEQPTEAENSESEKTSVQSVIYMEPSADDAEKEE